MVRDGGDGNSAVPLCCASPSAEAGQGLAFKAEVWHACARHLCVQSSSECQSHVGCRICWKACLKCPEGNSQHVRRPEPPGPYFSIIVRAGLLEAALRLLREHCLGSPHWTEEGWHTLGKGSLGQMTLPILFCSKMNVPWMSHCESP